MQLRAVRGSKKTLLAFEGFGEAREQAEIVSG